MKPLKRMLTPSLTVFLFLCAAQIASAFYDPSLGRWLNRDPIQERGGLNLAGFTRNAPINRIDPKGNWCLSTSICVLSDADYEEGNDPNCSTGKSYVAYCFYDCTFIGEVGTTCAGLDEPGQETVHDNDFTSEGCMPCRPYNCPSVFLDVDLQLD